MDDSILETAGLCLLRDVVVTIVVSDRKAQAGRVDATVTPDEQSAEDGLGHEIEDTVKDCFRVWRNHVAALADAPGNRVADPQEAGERAAHEKCAADVGAVAAGVASGFPDKVVEDVSECEAAFWNISVVLSCCILFIYSPFR